MNTPHTARVPQNMRYLPLLLLAACAFDTHSMPGAGDHRDPPRDGVEVLAHADAEVDGAAGRDADAADPEDVGSDASLEGAGDAAAPSVPDAGAGTADAGADDGGDDGGDAAADMGDPADAAGPDGGVDVDAAVPAEILFCQTCDGTIPCAEGLHCKSVVNLDCAAAVADTCRPDLFPFAACRCM